MRIKVDGSLLVIDQVPFEAINLLVAAANMTIVSNLKCEDSLLPIATLADAMSEIITKKFQDAWNDKDENELLLDLSSAELRAIIAMCAIGLKHLKMDGSVTMDELRSLSEASVTLHRVSALHIARANMKCS